MERWAGRVALVSGASSGIGAAVAEKLVKEGMVVIGCGRNVNEINTLSERLMTCSGTLHGVQCDLRREEEILSMFNVINKKYGGLDVCINNAGLGKNASVIDGKTEDWREMIDVNVVALSICTREAIRAMKLKGVDDGHIINICSTGAHALMKENTIHWYCATKTMVTSLTENLRIELRAMGSRIRASQISPGVVNTDFSSRRHGEVKAMQRRKEREALNVDQMASAILYILSAEPNMEVNDMIIRPTSQLE